MYILAFILLIFSLIKLCIVGSTSYIELKEFFEDTYFSIIKTIIFILLLDSILGAVCSLYILLW